MALGVVVSLLAVGLVYQQVSARRSHRRITPPGRLIDAGGHRLHVVCRGTGRPFVMIESGIAASSLSWAVVQPAIARFTRVCTYDRAGLGWSDPPSCLRTFDRILDELTAVLAHVAPDERLVLVGHSFGSFVVRGFAARHPSRVLGLVLVDPPIEWLTMTAEQSRMLRRGADLSRIGAALARVGVVRASLSLLTGGAPGAPRRLVRAMGPRVSGTLERLVGEVRKLPPEVHPALQAIWSDPKCFTSMADHLRVLEREAKAIGEAIPPPEIPVVVISGGNQPPEQLAAHQALTHASTHGRHVVAARSTHWVQFDEPELIVSAVRELVEGADEVPGA